MERKKVPGIGGSTESPLRAPRLDDGRSPLQNHRSAIGSRLEDLATRSPSPEAAPSVAAETFDHPLHQGHELALCFRDASLVLEQLEGHRGTFRLLCVIHYGGPSSLYEMRRWVPVGQRALIGSLRTLLALRLVEPVPAAPFPYSRAKRFRLTDRGRALMRTPIEEWSRLVRLWSCV